MKTRIAVVALLIGLFAFSAAPAEARNRGRVRRLLRPSTWFQRGRNTNTQRAREHTTNAGRIGSYTRQYQLAEQLVSQIRNEHGRKAYTDALAFAREHNLPVATTQKSGQPRLLINVTSSSLAAWTQKFSSGKCYIEPFFNGHINKSAPGWSMFRNGDKSYQQYGTGSSYSTRTSGGRTAFPIRLTEQEHRQVMNEIHTRENASFNYNGGNPVRTATNSSGRNCTNWITYVIGQFTGVTTASVKHHSSALLSGNRSGRVTVQAVMSNEKINNFDASYAAKR